ATSTSICSSSTTGRTDLGQGPPGQLPGEGLVGGAHPPEGFSRGRPSSSVVSSSRTVSGSSGAPPEATSASSSGPGVPCVFVGSLIVSPLVRSADRTCG